MTNFFNFDELTWPEVKELQRDVPLIIPLGPAWNTQMLAGQLSNPPQAGILPSIPFGWPGSGLAVPEPVFCRLLSNLISGLREDGFTRVHALIPQGLNVNLIQSGFDSSSYIVQPQPEANVEAILQPPDAEREKVILIPIGHTEQHGLHLPLCVDTVIIDSIARETASRVTTRSFVLPTMPYGVSTHRASFAGTLNTGGRAFEDFWLAVIDRLAGRGFDRFYFISGHGGNMSFLVNIVKYAGERHRRIFCATAFLHTSGPAGVEALEKYRTSETGGMGHACELETSMMLWLRPELCHMERVVDEVDFIRTPSFYMDWIEGGALIANPPWDDDSRTGAYGAGSHGTAEKGRLWLEAAVTEKICHIDEIHEQHERRERRRNEGYGLWAKFQKSGG
jgi:creatinine amidohydrolase